jgi:HEPN domain-containing protein
LIVMSAVAPNELAYVAWQNRAFRFYLGARLLLRNELFAPAAYSATMALELLLKATLVYWDRSFNPLEAGHGMAKLARVVKNKARNAEGLVVPEYFYADQRYLSVSRYPTSGRGVVIPSSFLVDLDHTFVNLIVLVPFQHNTELKRALSGAKYSALTVLRYKNSEMKRLRKSLGVRLK